MPSLFGRSRYGHLPTPPGATFFLGHAWDVREDQRVTGNDELPLTITFREWAKKVSYSPVFVVFLINQNIVATIDPEYVKRVLESEENDKLTNGSTSITSFVNVFGQRFMGESVFSTITHHDWRPRREWYTPGFKEDHVHTLFQSVNVCVDAFLDKLKPLADGTTTVQMKLQLEEFSTEVISKGVFGFDDKQATVASGGTFLSLLNHCHEALENMVSITGSLYKYLHPFSAADYTASIRDIRRIGREHIEKKIKMIESGEQQVATDILSKCLQMACSDGHIDVNMEQQADNFLAFYIGGRQPMVSVLTFALILTLQHPEALARVQAEAEEVFKDKSGIDSIEDLKKLQYTQQILEETMRMYMTIPQLRRCLAKDEKFGEYDVPQGSIVYLLGDVMCNMSKHFERPEVFDPTRFDPGKPRPDPGVYINFGVGPRSCLGRHFAMMVMKITFAKLMKTYKMTLPEGYKIVAAQRIITQVKDDVPCVLESR